MRSKQSSTSLVLDLAVDAIAVYRLARLVTADKFPPIRWAREAVEDWSIQPENRVEHNGKIEANPLGELVTCRWCASFYLAVGAVAARRFAPRWWDPLAKALAFSAGAALISRLETD